MQTSEQYSATVAPHSSVLLRVSGVRSWRHGVVYEAEWPGLKRDGAASLFPCGKCSHGYAMALGGDGRRGALRFSPVQIPTDVPYTLRLTYTRNGLEDKQIDLDVNGTRTQVKAIMRFWNWVDVPVTLHAGANRIAVSYDGQRSFYLDSLTWLRNAPESAARVSAADAKRKR